MTAATPICNLHYTDLDIGAYDPAFHLRPPLREPGDRAALREALADGTLDAVCSDHRPYDGEAKHQPFARCAAGVAGFEALLPLLLELVSGGVPLARPVVLNFGDPCPCQWRASSQSWTYRAALPSWPPGVHASALPP